MDDERFEAVGYQVVHSRIASSVAEHLVHDLTKEECDTLLTCLSVSAPTWKLNLPEVIYYPTDSV